MQRRKSNPESGMTFVELVVAATLMGLFALFLAPAGQMQHALLDEIDARTSNFQSAQLVRTRFTADAVAATSAICVTGDRIGLNMGAAPSTTVEYRIDGDRLIRWSLPPDKEFFVAGGLADLTCSSLGGEGLEVDVIFEDRPTPFTLHMMIAEVAA